MSKFIPFNAKYKIHVSHHCYLPPERLVISFASLSVGLRCCWGAFMILWYSSEVDQVQYFGFKRPLQIYHKLFITLVLYCWSFLWSMFLNLKFWIYILSFYFWEKIGASAPSSILFNISAASRCISLRGYVHINQSRSRLQWSVIQYICEHCAVLAEFWTWLNGSPLFQISF